LHEDIREYIRELALKIKWEYKKNLLDDFVMQMKSLFLKLLSAKTDRYQKPKGRRRS